MMGSRVALLLKMMASIMWLLSISCLNATAQPTFQYATVSWRELSGDGATNMGFYAIDHCAGFAVSDFGSYRPRLGDQLGPQHKVGHIRTPSIVSININCTVTQVYQRGTIICCGSTSLSLSRDATQVIIFSSVLEDQSVKSSIPVGTSLTASPRFIDVVAHGQIMLNPPPAQQTVILPFQSGSVIDSIIDVPVNSEMFKFDIANRMVTIKPGLGSSDSTVTLSGSRAGATSQLLLSYAFTNETLNRVPVMNTTTQQLLQLTNNNFYPQQQTHSFLVSASDPDNDPVWLFASGTAWPEGASLNSVTPPYVPKCPPSNSSCILYTDADYPQTTGITTYRIEWTPTPQQAAQNKTWTLCVRARDIFDAVSFDTTCLSLYVPAPCPNVTTSVFSHGSVSIDGPIPVVGRTATWRCDSNRGIYFNNTGSMNPIIQTFPATYQTQCTTKGWNGITNVQCKVVCSPPAAVLHGTWSISSLMMASDTVTYTCDTGYTHNTTQQTYTCTDKGTLDIQQVPGCKPVPCPALSPIFNGQTTLINGTDRTKAQFSCDEGFTLIGSREAVCSPTGTWSDSPPRCFTSPCGPINQTSLPSNVRVIDIKYESNPDSVNIFAILGCPDNWILNGGYNITCQAGRWIIPTTTCTAQCQVAEILPPMGAEITTVVGAYVPVGTKLSVKCTQQGQYFAGQAFYTCTNQLTSNVDHALGTWDAPVGSCVTACQRSLIPAVVDTTPSGIDAYLVGPSPSSILTAGNLVVNGNIPSNALLLSGLQIYRTCDRNVGNAQNKNGIITVTCQAGTWTTPTTCTAICPLPSTSIAHVSQTTLSNTYVSRSDQGRFLVGNQILTVSCENGYELKGSTSMTCSSDGQLSGAGVGATCVQGSSTGVPGPTSSGPISAASSDSSVLSGTRLILAIAGGIVAVILLILLTIIAIICIRRRMHQQDVNRMNMAPEKLADQIEGEGAPHVQRNPAIREGDVDVELAGVGPGAELERG